MRAQVSSLVVVGVLIGLLLPAVAEIPRILTYQGKVTDAGGTPVADGDYAMTFEIYSAASGGTSLWSSGGLTVTVSGGVFSVLLGDAGQPALSLDFSADYWVETDIEGDIQSPRTRVGSVGYAYMASGLVAGTEVEGSVSSGDLAAISGTNLSTVDTPRGLYGSATGTTGRGVEGWATSPTGYTFGGRFESQSTDGRGVLGHASASTGITYGVRGTCNSTAGTAVCGIAQATEGTTYGVFGQTNSSDGFAGYFNGRGYFSGNVGIGTTTPVRALSVVGYVRGANAADETEYVEIYHGGSNGFINWNGDGNFDIRYDNDAKVTVQQDGNVGIGTMNPGAKLDVRGDAVFNEHGGDYDFRVEGDTQPNLLSIDASTDRVGIGTATPNATLDVRGSAIFNDDGADRDFRVEGDTQPNLLQVDASTDRVGIRTATPNATLDVRGSAVFNEDGGDNDFRIEGQYDPNLLFCDASASAIGIGTNSPGHNLDVAGSVGATGWIGHHTGGTMDAWLGPDTEEGCGRLEILGANGNRNFVVTGYPNNGYASVNDSNGFARAGIYVTITGNGIVWGDTKNFRMANPKDPNTEIWYACIEGPEAAAYLRGTARLENGRATITFPEHFQAVAISQGMTVQLTPLSAACKGLAVTRKSTQGIEVEELWNGTGTYDFDYTVMAVRAGHEDYKVIRPKEELAGPVGSRE